MRFPARLLIAALAFISASSATEKPQQNTPTFGAITNFVQVPVIVQKSGKHVAGLKKEDFVLRQDGKEQAIASLEEIRGDEKPTAPTTPGTQDQFGNQPGQIPPQITIIALDMINTPNLDRTYFIQEFERYLTKQAKFPGPMGVVAIERTGIRVIKGFTTDAKVVLTAVLEHATSQPSNNKQTSSAERSLSDTIISQDTTQLSSGPDLVPLSVALKMREADEAMGRFQDRAGRIDAQLALQQLAQGLKGIPGRKSVLLVGSGFNFIDSKIIMRNISAGGNGGQDYKYSVENGGEALNQAAYTWKLLNDANVAVYPIDTRRTYNPAFAAQDTANVNTPSDLSYKQLQQGDQDILATFKSIAAATGGRPCFYRTDLDNCVREAVDDDHDYYLLGFYADNKNNQPGWHRIEVKLDQKADVRYRQGFILAKFNPEAQRKNDIGMALNSPFAFTELPFSGQFVSFSGASGKAATFNLLIPPGTMTVDPGGHLDFDVIAIARSQGGKEAARFLQRVNRNFPQPSIEEIQKDGINYSNRLELASGEYGVWFVVRDNLSGRTGSAVVPLKVP